MFLMQPPGSPCTNLYKFSSDAGWAFSGTLHAFKSETKCITGSCIITGIHECMHGMPSKCITGHCAGTEAQSWDPPMVPSPDSLKDAIGENTLAHRFSIDDDRYLYLTFFGFFPFSLVFFARF